VEYQPGWRAKAPPRHGQRILDQARVHVQLCMSLLWFQRNPLPTDWVAQREVGAGFNA
jgi:hypothetical protein